MKFPPQIDPATGRFVTASEEESVKESVYLILMTQRTERFLRPEFGSDFFCALGYGRDFAQFLGVSHKRQIIIAARRLAQNESVG